MTEKTTPPPDFDDLEILTNDLKYDTEHEGLFITMEGFQDPLHPLISEDKDSE